MATVVQAVEDIDSCIQKCLRAGFGKCKSIQFKESGTFGLDRNECTLFSIGLKHMGAHATAQVLADGGLGASLADFCEPPKPFNHFPANAVPDHGVDWDTVCEGQEMAVVPGINISLQDVITMYCTSVRIAFHIFVAGQLCHASALPSILLPLPGVLPLVATLETLQQFSSSPVAGMQMGCATCAFIPSDRRGRVDDLDEYHFECAYQRTAMHLIYTSLHMNALGMNAQAICTLAKLRNCCTIL